MIFSVVNIARFMKVDPAYALAQTNAKFSRRFRIVEHEIQASGRQMKDCTLAQMDEIWIACAPPTSASSGPAPGFQAARSGSAGSKANDSAAAAVRRLSSTARHQAQNSAEQHGIAEITGRHPPRAVENIQDRPAGMVNAESGGCRIHGIPVLPWR